MATTYTFSFGTESFFRPSTSTGFEEIPSEPLGMLDLSPFIKEDNWSFLPISPSIQTSTFRYLKEKTLVEKFEHSPVFWITDFGYADIEAPEIAHYVYEDDRVANIVVSGDSDSLKHLYIGSEDGSAVFSESNYEASNFSGIFHIRDLEPGIYYVGAVLEKHGRKSRRSDTSGIWIPKEINISANVTGDYLQQINVGELSDDGWYLTSRDDMVKVFIDHSYFDEYYMDGFIKMLVNGVEMHSVRIPDDGIVHYPIPDISDGNRIKIYLSPNASTWHGAENLLLLNVQAGIYGT